MLIAIKSGILIRTGRESVITSTGGDVGNRPRQALFWTLISVTALIIAYQVFVPPIIGLADQGDFRRTIGVFGYGPAQPYAGLIYAYVTPKYIPDPTFRLPGWDHITSEYPFTAAAVLFSKIVSKDNRLDVTAMGFVHTLVFLAVFSRLLLVSRRWHAHVFFWIGAAIILTDVGYVSYWNSFYTEPASCIFFLLLLAESIDICNQAAVSLAGLLRWALWAVLFVLAKPQNGPVGLLLALFSCNLRFWVADRVARRVALLSAGTIFIASVSTVLSAPKELRNANTYNIIFLSILPESRDPAADLQALGMDPQLKDYSRTGAWSPGTIYPALESSGVIGTRVTLGTTVGFYLLRPTRLWRHISAILPIATSLRAECCGNFEPSAGLPPGARSSAWAVWSGIHERVLSKLVKVILFSLPISTLMVIINRIRHPKSPLLIDFGGLLAACCFVAFMAAAFGDAWETVKHLLLFNLILDFCLLLGATSIWSLRKGRALYDI